EANAAHGWTNCIPKRRMVIDQDARTLTDRCRNVIVRRVKCKARGRTVQGELRFLSDRISPDNAANHGLHGSQDKESRLSPGSAHVPNKVFFLGYVGK